MNTDIVIYLTALFFLFFGWAVAAVTYGRRYYKFIKPLKEQLKYEYEDGYNAGQASILQDPEAIKKAYTYFFLTN